MKRRGTFAAILHNKDIRKALLYTFAVLFIYRLGCSIPVPGIDATILTDAVYSSSILTMMNMLSGGSLSNFSIFALGISPYITASIIVQLLSMDVIPSWTEMTKSGEKGRKQLNRITRNFGLILAIVQAFSITYTFDKNYSILSTSGKSAYVLPVILLTAGYCGAVWVSDKITKHGISNGMSMLIFAGIVSELPAIFVNTYNILIGSADDGVTASGIVYFVLFCLLYLLIVFTVIFMETSYKKIKIMYANRRLDTMNSDDTYIPIKVNSASVIPVIFAQSVINVLLLVSGLISTTVYDKINNVFSLSSVSGIIIYAVMVILFTFLYTDMELNPEDMASNLSKGGGYLPGVRPGKDTERALRKIIMRVTVAGAIGLTILAVLPYILSMCTSLSTASAIGGTGIIIVVGVAMESVNSMKTIAVPTKKYKYF